MLTLSKTKKGWLLAGLIILALFLAWQIISAFLIVRLKDAYLSQQSRTLTDRNGRLIEVTPNARGYYDQFLTDAPPQFSNLLLKKEDRFFYFHFGFNPISWARDAFSYLINGKRTGSSTLSQQLVKTILQNENDRSLSAKIKELVYTLSLETRASKKQILIMYLNSAYFGNLSQGLKQAALDYFNTPPENLNNAQIFSLLAALNSPSATQPGSGANLKQAQSLAVAFKIKVADADWQNLTLAQTDAASSRTGPSAFEVNSLNPKCQSTCALSLDSRLTESVRQILKKDLASPDLDTAQNGAVVILKEPENEILALVGSPDPSSSGLGLQLNMAAKPRPIGSTAKPFIYLKAFENGARPYTLVDDTEIKYQIGTGFDFFPKNFDGKYRGLVTLHQALDNSLNVPSVQVLEYAGLPNFYGFLRNGLAFHSLQPLENYELGIALGGLEMDPLTLSYYFSLFPQGGVLKPLTLYKSGGLAGPYFKPPMADLISAPKAVGNEADVELVNKILNDRQTGVDQFGIKSNLNLPYTNYGLKTGTSRDYHDSWTLGFTPDFVVGVWVGNSDNRAMRQITGLSGAAKIWREVMETMYNSGYNKNTPLNFSKVREIQSGDSLDFGLQGDVYDTARNIMLNPQTIILAPHQNDKFLLQPGTTIPLSANQPVSWSVDGKFLGKGTKLDWPATEAGSFTIEAQTSDGKKDQVTVYINKE